MKSLLAFLFMAAVTPLLAQDARHEIAPDRGFLPSNSYQLSDIEEINMGTGSVSLHIPIVSLPKGRAGFQTGISLSYSDKYWDTIPSNPTSGFTTYYLQQSPSGGWHYRAGYELQNVQGTTSDGDS